MVGTLGFDTCPDYDALRDVLHAGLGPSPGLGCVRLEFSCSAAAVQKLVSTARRRSLLTATVTCRDPAGDPVPAVTMGSVAGTRGVGRRRLGSVQAAG